MDNEDDVTNWNVETEHKGKAQEAFQKEVWGYKEPPEKPSQDIEADNTPGMIKDDKPVPRPRPKGMGEDEIDRQVFNEKWGNEQRQATYRQTENEYEQPGNDLRDGFNTKADEVGRAEREAQAAQEQLESMRKNGVELNPPLDLGKSKEEDDPFDKIDAQQKERGMDRSRDH